VPLVLDISMPLAGMPQPVLTDIASARLQTISFFLLLIALSAGVVMWVWNAFRKDFPRLPRMSYWRSLGAVAVWGAAFMLVLTMISGARELMTPGAWERTGVTYKLVDGTRRKITLEDRRARLTVLKTALGEYARDHDGASPSDDHDPSIPAWAWETADPSRSRFLYVPPSRGGTVIAFEPSSFSPRLVLLRSGHIETMTDPELSDALSVGAKP
jgi:hypothetical protein